MNQISQDDFSRRYSIDSFSRGPNSALLNPTTPSLGSTSINVGSFSNVPSFNRFNTISENEYEEPSINQKFFQYSDNSNAMRRISTLQTRNKQVKPHLQSSYALEDVTASLSENQIRGDQWNKENNRVFIIFTNLFLNIIERVFNLIK
jgi:hypothetical protein